MQTLANNSQLIPSLPISEFYPIRNNGRKPNTPSVEDKLLSLKAVYRQLFKENRDLDFHHEYIAAFGEQVVPFRRSAKLSLIDTPTA